MQLLRIFTYHNIDTPPKGAQLPKLYIDVEQFDRQCWLLKKLGIRGVSMSAGLAELDRGCASRSVVLSFDDGYMDNLCHAEPVLRRYGFHAICYVVSGGVGGYNFWDAEKLKVEKPIMDQRAIGQWLAAGHEIGSHTVSHPALTRLSRSQAAQEISASRQQLQRITATPVAHFCYPFGDHNDLTVDLVREAGYESAVTTCRGPAVPGSDRLRLPRISINRGRGLFKYGLHAATRYCSLRRQR